MTQRKLMRGYVNRQGCGWSTVIQASVAIDAVAMCNSFKRDQTEAQKKSPLVERA